MHEDAEREDEVDALRRDSWQISAVILDGNQIVRTEVHGQLVEEFLVVIDGVDRSSGQQIPGPTSPTWADLEHRGLRCHIGGKKVPLDVHQRLVPLWVPPFQAIYLIGADGITGSAQPTYEAPLSI